MTVLSKSHNNCLGNFWLAHLQAVGALDVIFCGRKNCFLGDGAMNMFSWPRILCWYLFFILVNVIGDVALFLVPAWYFPPLDLVQPPLVVAIYCKCWYYYFSVAFLPLLVCFLYNFLKTFANCFNDSISSHSVLLDLVVIAFVSLLEASMTVSYGVTIGEVSYLCLENSVSTIISDPVCLL